MLLFNKLLLPVCFLASFVSFGQNYKTNPGHRFTKEEMREFLLDKSKQQKTKAYVALIGGPVLTASGLLLFNREPSVVVAGNGWIQVRDSPSGTAGSIIAAAGVITTLTSIPLFISSARSKREAQLLLKEESTSFLNKQISIPGLTLRVAL